MTISLADLALASQKNQTVLAQTKGDELYMDTTTHHQLLQISLEHIKRDEAQPRTFFDEHEIEQLAQSIDEVGLLQPISVKEVDTDQFVIIAGERRYRAFQKLGRTHIPCIVMNQTDTQNTILALVENVSRENLQDFEVYKAIIKVREHLQVSDPEGKAPTQEQLANVLGINRFKLMRFLSFSELPQGVQDLLSKHPYLLPSTTAQKFIRQLQNVDEGTASELVGALVDVLQSIEKDFVQTGVLDCGNILGRVENLVYGNDEPTEHATPADADDDRQDGGEIEPIPQETNEPVVNNGVLRAIKYGKKPVATIKQKGDKVTIALPLELYERYFSDIANRFDDINTDLQSQDADADDSTDGTPAE